MSILPDYRHMPRPKKKFPSIEEITEEMSKEEPRPDYVMTPKEMLEMADQMERGSYRGTINLMMSWNKTIEELRKHAYEILENN